jgi:hypothetical protein
MSVIPATHEAEVGESWSKASPGKVSRRTSLKNKLKAKELEAWLKRQSIFLPSVRT